MYVSDFFCKGFKHKCSVCYFCQRDFYIIFIICLLDISISSAEVTIINGNNLCTVKEIPSTSSSKKMCTPNHRTQTSLNEGARDGKFTDGSTQPPSLTVPNLKPEADADSCVCCVPKAVGESFIDSSPVLKYRSK